MLYDLAIIGAGINGAGIARDAAGRGLSVFLCDQGDIGGATSSASTKLIHGGLRYLEHYEFRLVHEALKEREILWRMAPHIVRPMRFVLPHQPTLRPAWMIQLGLFLYDHLGRRTVLEASQRLSLKHHPAGAPLDPRFHTGFCYSDCWVEDNRLVVLNAKDAAERGAVVRPHTACTHAERQGNHWQITLGNGSETITARALVNACGPWVNATFTQTLGQQPPLPIRMVKGSHIVVPRLFDHPYSYIFQHDDGRIVFAIPFEQDFTLIGTTDQDYTGDPAQACASVDETVYLCSVINSYFKVAITPSQVVWSYSGVRPLMDSQGGSASAASRDYHLHLEGGHSGERGARAEAGGAPLLSVYGGKITTYRKLAEAALAKLAPVLPHHNGRPDLSPIPWTEHAPLPGGDVAIEQWDEWLTGCQARWPWIPQAMLTRMARTYGTRIDAVLGSAQRLNHLGNGFGAHLYEAELDYLCREEWVKDAKAALWHRTKLGLHLRPDQRHAVEAWFTRRHLPG